MTEFENNQKEFNDSFTLLNSEANQGDKFQIGIKRVLNAVWNFLKNPFDLQRVTQQGSTTDREIIIFRENDTVAITVKAGASPNSKKIELKIDTDGNGQLSIYDKNEVNNYSINGQRGVMLPSFSLADIKEEHLTSISKNALITFSNGSEVYKIECEKK